MRNETKGIIAEQLATELLKIRVVEKVELEVHDKEGWTLEELNDLGQDWSQAVLLIHHDANNIEDFAKYLDTKNRIKKTALNFFKEKGVRLGDPIEDNGTYFYMVFYNNLKTD